LNALVWSTVKPAITKLDPNAGNSHVASPYRVPTSVDAKGDFGNFQSLEQYVDGCI